MKITDKQIRLLKRRKLGLDFDKVFFSILLVGGLLVAIFMAWIIGGIFWIIGWIGMSNIDKQLNEVKFRLAGQEK